VRFQKISARLLLAPRVVCPPRPLPPSTPPRSVTPARNPVCHRRPKLQHSPPGSRLQSDGRSPSLVTPVPIPCPLRQQDIRSAPAGVHATRERGVYHCATTAHSDLANQPSQPPRTTVPGEDEKGRKRKQQSDPSPSGERASHRRPAPLSSAFLLDRVRWCP
jgi:hypothetical protein